MTRKNARISFLRSVVAILSLGLATAAAAKEHAGGQQVEASEASQEQVQDSVENQLAERRKAMLEEAQTALDETNTALKALEAGQNDEALAALERVTGKLELIIARDPTLALAPVDLSVVTHDIYASPESVRLARDEAEKQLERGRVQRARALLAEMGSEVVINVTNLPLASYSDAIKAVSPLIDAGKTEAARTALRAALNTLVVTRQVIPLPPLRARAMLDEAEQILGAETPPEQERPSDDRATEADRLIDGAKLQIEIAQLLGYGDEADYQPFRDQIAELENELGRSEETTGIFARLQKTLDRLQESFVE